MVTSPVSSLALGGRKPGWLPVMATALLAGTLAMMVPGQLSIMASAEGNSGPPKEG